MLVDVHAQREEHVFVEFSSELAFAYLHTLLVVNLKMQMKKNTKGQHDTSLGYASVKSCLFIR